MKGLLKIGMGLKYLGEGIIELCGDDLENEVKREREALAAALRSAEKSDPALLKSIPPEVRDFVLSTLEGKPAEPEAAKPVPVEDAAESEDAEDEEEAAPVKAAPVKRTRTRKPAAKPAPVEDEDEDDADDDDEEEAAAPAKAVKRKPAPVEDEDEDDADDDDEEEAAAPKKHAAPALSHAEVIDYIKAERPLDKYKMQVRQVIKDQGAEKLTEVPASQLAECLEQIKAIRCTDDQLAKISPTLYKKLKAAEPKKEKKEDA